MLLFYKLEFSKIALLVYNKKKLKENLDCQKNAERKGFEPSIRIAPYTHFPGARLRPLGHLSLLVQIK